ncbi:MAG: TVP38/TMEM64 family protein [Halofilum sp. (in: g-proteobacteria)]|nr:TVP38/TMEM64 family protein [Halofilum sp. (in: g-proteobacteria)]
MTRLVVAVGLLVALAWAGWELHVSGHLSRGHLLALGERFGPLGPLIIAGALVLAVVVGPIPTIPVTIASGILYGPVAGFFWAMIGSLIGAAFAFAIARLAGRPFVERFTGGHIALCADCSDKLLFWVIAGCRLLPVISFAAVSYGAGLTAMRMRSFLLATALGMVPMTALYVGIGAAVEVDPLWAGVGGLLAVVLLVALPVLVERYDPFGLMRFFRHAEANGNDGSGR